ncbi:MAG: molybdopterin-guanine dinucleotide biosynthesis protein A [Alphaproteobacteria bacterium]|nr:molybdopterin-guanine dinucleotide biosynthesis protein A [Alphaproteobacteria bacterium]
MRATVRAILVTAIGAAGAVALSPATRSDEVPTSRHAGYYYPSPSSTETYVARTRILADSDRQRRIGFVTLLTNQMLQNPYPPQFAMFAKGEHAEKLIIVGLHDQGFSSIYRARALLAMLTAAARVSPLFRETSLADVLTFLDLVKLLGFELVTVSDGREFAHQIVIE